MPLNTLNLGKGLRETKITPGAVIEYEQHGKALLGVVRSEKKNKWLVVNERGQELDLPAERITLLPGAYPEREVSLAGAAQFLTTVGAQAEKLRGEFSLEELWSVMEESRRELEVAELAEMVFSGNSLEAHVAVRRALLEDTIYFKRKKTGFEPRPGDVVEELKTKAEAEARKGAARAELKGALLARIRGAEVPVPGAVSELEKIAAEGTGAPNAKEGLQLIDEIREELKWGVTGRGEDRAFEVLVAAKHFSPDHDLNLIKSGRDARFSGALLAEAEKLLRSEERFLNRKEVVASDIFSIDSITTRDIDDALSLERLTDGFRVGIHIADVAAVIPEESLLMRESLRRTTSVYAPDYQIPMLPPLLSEEGVSLVAGEKRAAMSFFVEFDSALQLRSRTVESTVITVTRRMTYDEVDRILFDEEGGGDPLGATLLDLWQIVCEREASRLSAGALQFSRRELNPSIQSDGMIVLEDTSEDTPARKLVSELMILANETGALFAAEHGVSLVFRGQERPDVNVAEQGQHIPEGPAREYAQRGFLKRSTVGVVPCPHFGLGIKAYSQLTSPIRRVVDLINQRQLSTFLAQGAPRYTADEVSALLIDIEPYLDEASYLQRTRHRYWLHRFLMQEGITHLPAVVVRVDGPKPLAELEVIYTLSTFVPMRREGGAHGLKVGQRVNLKIQEIHPRRELFLLSEV